MICSIFKSTIHHKLIESMLWDLYPHQAHQTRYYKNLLNEFYENKLA